MLPSPLSTYIMRNKDAIDKVLLARMMADLLKIHETFVTKADAFEKLMEKNREMLLNPDKTELLKLIKPLVRHGMNGETPSDDKLLALIEPLIKMALHGKIPTKEETFESIRDMLPVFEQPKIVLTDEHINTIADKVTDNMSKRNIKVNMTDPLQILDQIMALPEEKRISTKHVNGLDQTIHAIQSQLKRHYLHGGGISSLIAGSGITLVKNADGSYTITSSSTGSTTAVQTLVPTQVGSDITLDLTGLAHVFTSVLGVTRQGIFVTPSASDGWSRVGNTITVKNASDSDTYQVMYTY